MLTYGSICSGIEAATVAFSSLGWKPSWFSEIEPFPCDLLRVKYPHVWNIGDITKNDFISNVLRFKSPDVIIGGTPCQAFSLAGLRGGLKDQRGNLTLKFVEICNALNPRVILWENVPGVLSDKTNAFGHLLAGLSGLPNPVQRSGYSTAGYISGPCRSVAWRTLNAKYFGVPQQRRRIFLVASLRKEHCAEILFEQKDFIGLSKKGHQAEKDIIPTLTTRGDYLLGGVSCQIVNTNGQIRSLTPIECERLMGFPDNYTLINPFVTDAIRYKALGNSMVVPVIRWLGERIQDVLERNEDEED